MPPNAENRSKNSEIQNGFVPFEIFAKKYAIGKEVGRGGFGKVYKSRRISDGQPTAIKFIPKKKVFHWEKIDGREIPLEVVLMEKCQSVPGVIRLFDYTEGPTGFLIAMERPAKGMDLYEFHNQIGFISEATARRIFRQTVETLRDCAKLGVAHRDLKEENIIVDLSSGTSKLIDFGGGAWMCDGPYSDFLGTPVYAPPEWFEEEKYEATPAAVWSLGILLFDLLMGDVPYETCEEVVSNFLHVSTEWCDEISVDCQSLILGCLASKPEDRLSFDEILNHKWVFEC